MRVVIANFSHPIRKLGLYSRYWARQRRPDPPASRRTLFEYDAGWGFHIFAMGIRLLDLGLADEVEFWSCGEQRSMRYESSGVLWVHMYNKRDVAAYVDRFGAPDLFINYGILGHGILPLLEGKSFRVHIPCMRKKLARRDNHDAECYLVDDERFLDDRSMLYVPVVNTEWFRPSQGPKVRDFVYLANVRPGKRHDILLDAVRETGMSGHLHPVSPGELDLGGLEITTSGWDEADVVELLSTSRIAVAPGDQTSNPAAMWECVACDLPLVLNRDVVGGRHAVVSGVTGELATAETFGRVMRQALDNVDSYRPRAHFLEAWDTLSTLETYFSFFERMGWRRPSCS